MKTKYKNKLRLVKKYLSWDEGLDEKTFNKYADDGFDIMRSLAKTKDVEVLSELLDLFNKKTEWYGGVCETLDNDIWDNYSPEQIIYALKMGKFRFLLENELLRACTMSIAIINTGYWKELRKIFNEQRSEKSENFVKDLYRWGSEGNYKEYALILENDMKKWK